MKTKRLDFLLLCMALLASCSQDETITTAEQAVDENAPQPIIMGMNTRPTVTVKGGGAVGGVGIDDNVWAGQTVRIYAVTRHNIPETLSLSNTGEEVLSPLGYGVDIVPDTVETTSSGYIILKNYSQPEAPTYYYPRGGEFNFFGFHADDAIRQGFDLNSDHYENGAHYIEFEIDGTQDLMLAKGSVSQLNDPADERYLFSAKSSRLGYRPTLNFEHQLTQLRFFIEQSDNVDITGGAPAEVYVDNISIRSRTRGKMFFIYPDDADGTNKGIVWDEDQSTTALVLKKKNDQGEMVSLNEGINKNSQTWRNYWTGVNTKDDLLQNIGGTPIDSVLGFYHLDADNLQQPVRIGDCLLVEPGLDSYEMTFDVTQYFDKNGNYIHNERDRVVNYRFNINQRLEAGYRYDIYIVINDIEDIELKASLNPWGEEDTIRIDPFE